MAADISGSLDAPLPVLSRIHPPTEYVQVAYVETLSGLTRGGGLAVTQVNMVKTLLCRHLHTAALLVLNAENGRSTEGPTEESGGQTGAA